MNTERLRILSRIHRRMALRWDDGETNCPDHGAGCTDVDTAILDVWERDFENFVSVVA